ncbi:MAG TPA: 3'-5' exonuclease, partial [Nannocystaceae bacterium]|nr:3'-5' exonuclease [Nannocystaceae bacterium]
VVGDDDQAIYGWRGADVSQILDFAECHDGTEIIKLEQNYRSTGHILRCSDAVIRRNSGRLGKTLWTDEGDGEPVRVVVLETERDEARLVAREIRLAIDEGASPEEFAVFYRTHAQSRVLEDELRGLGMSCRIVGGVAFYERAEVKDLLSYLVAIHNPQSDTHLARILNRPARGIGNTTVQRLLAHAAAQGVSLWAALQSPGDAGVGAAPSKRLRAFVELFEKLRARENELTIDMLLAEIVEATGYREALLADGDDEAMARLENVQELVGNVAEFVSEHPGASIADYLERTSLVAGERAEGDRDRAITLMTVHSAKGLEFDTVYLTGMEERVFPHARVIDDPVQMEEERRLVYVAITRARRHLTLSMATRRRIYGQLQVGMASRFLNELPPDSVQGIRRAPKRPIASTPAPPREKSWNDDVVYDAAADVTLERDELEGEVGEGVQLFVGMAVRHKEFGVGELLGWQGVGKNLKFHLRFGGVTKTIMARFCDPM